MIRITLAQLRSSRRQFVAAGLAIALAAAYVATTLLASALLTQAIRDAVSTSYRGSDVVVTADSSPDSSGALPAGALAAVRGLAGVAGADPVAVTYTELVSGPRTTGTLVTSLPDTPRLRQVAVSTGRLPAAVDELALTRGTARDLGLVVGSRVQARIDPFTTDGTPATAEATVVGLLADQQDALGLLPDVVASPATVAAWTKASGQTAGTSRILVAAAPGTSPEALREAVAALPGLRSTRAEVRTAQQQADADLVELTDGIDILTALLLALAAVAVFAAGLVIANTFGVMVAQRTRTLALLRCVGATRRQVRRSVRLEALVLGAIASAAGVGLAIGLVNVVAVLLHRARLALPVPATVTPTATAVLVPFLLGVLVAVLAAFAPARAATRVAPVAALRPAAEAPLRSVRTGARMAIGGLLVAAGGAGLVMGTTLSSAGRSADGLLPGVLGGMVSFVGVLVLAPVLVPRLVGFAGRVAARVGGTPGRIAAANAVRNPRRTSTTAVALVIGVTLVSTIVTGAAAVRASLDARLDRGYPVDVVASTGSDAGPVDQQPEAVPAALVTRFGAVPGVDRALALPSANTEVRQQGGTAGLSLTGVDPARVRGLLKDRTVLSGLAPGTVLLGHQDALRLGVADGGRIQLTGTGGRSLTLEVRDRGLKWSGALVTPGDLDRLVPRAPASLVWLKLDGRADPATVRSALDKAVVEVTGSSARVSLSGPAIDQAVYVKVLRVMTWVAVGLLAVAVVIAVIGVANTLSLSVLERTRELGTLRALGLTRRRLRLMLAVEGGLIAGVGALVGVGLGLLYGWAGTGALIAGLTSPVYAAPVGALVALLAGGVLAGLLASVLPGRRAARLPATVALADQ